MASKDAIRGNFEVEVVRETIVKAADPLPERHNISLSNLDLLSGRFPVTYIYFYRRPSSIHSIKKTLMESLSQCLTHFYPFAGTISENMNSGEPEIICNNSGALVIEAQASIPLKEFDFYDLNQSLQGRLVSTNHHFPVQVQITSYICGGISMTFTFDHALGDASAFSKFLVTWSEIAMKKPISCSPDHSRDLPARFPPHYDPSLDESFISCSNPPQNKLYPNHIHIEELNGFNTNTYACQYYSFHGSTLSPAMQLQDAASSLSPQLSEMPHFHQVKLRGAKYHNKTCKC